jgi:hypothetical protein
MTRYNECMNQPTNPTPRTRDAIEQDAREMIEHVNDLLGESFFDPRERRIFMRELAKNAKRCAEDPIIRINIIHAM